MKYYSTYSVLYRLVGHVGRLWFSSKGYCTVIALRRLIFMWPNGKHSALHLLTYRKAGFTGTNC